ncbi:MAG TPA: A/G-specific adenine glycosylase [Chitinophagaceae bacterium]|nr:A/G-specific adenine glycosylase [Chitinophagaceae bacterium]
MKTFITKELYKSRKKIFFTRSILRWNEQVNKRCMPWKGEKDPYKIWLSEIILQQTRVEQGRAYYEKFIKAFPTIQKLANAEDEKVFKLWEGLGYYSRCKNLLASARRISTDHDGKFPDTYNDIITLKGVGTYTAAAIASFAYNLPYAVVDGNVIRVLSRYFGISIPINEALGKKLFQQIASDCLPATKAGIYNQAIMDFGAVQCKPQSPFCLECPLQKKCFAYLNQAVAALPVKKKSTKKKIRWFYFMVIHVGNKVYVRKRLAKDVWQNLFEYVGIEVSKEMDIPLFLKTKEFARIIGKGKGKIKVISKWYRQSLSHQTIYGRFIKITVDKPLASLQDFLLVKTDNLKNLPFPRLINSWHEEGSKKG